jgi:hypothetical protein
MYRSWAWSYIYLNTFLSLNKIFICTNSRPYSPSANTAVTCHYDITDTTSKKWAHLFLLSTSEVPVRRYTSVDDGTALYTGTILNDLNEVLCRTEKQKCMAVVITRVSSALIFVCKHP